jgi:altronate hydrolase
MLPAVNETSREEVSVSELVLVLSVEDRTGSRVSPRIHRWVVLLIGWFVPVEQCFLRKSRNFAVRNTARQSSERCRNGTCRLSNGDWYKDYASKFGAVLNNNPSPEISLAVLLNITIKSLGAVAKAGLPCRRSC